MYVDFRILDKTADSYLALLMREFSATITRKKATRRDNSSTLSMICVLRQIREVRNTVRLSVFIFSPTLFTSSNHLFRVYSSMWNRQILSAKLKNATDGSIRSLSLLIPPKFYRNKKREILHSVLSLLIIAINFFAMRPVDTVESHLGTSKEQV